MVVLMNAKYLGLDLNLLQNSRFSFSSCPVKRIIFFVGLHGKKYDVFKIFVLVKRAAAEELRSDVTDLFLVFCGKSFLSGGHF